MNRRGMLGFEVEVNLSNLHLLAGLADPCGMLLIVLIGANICFQSLEIIEIETIGQIHGSLRQRNPIALPFAETSPHLIQRWVQKQILHRYVDRIHASHMSLCGSMAFWRKEDHNTLVFSVPDLKYLGILWF